MYRPTYQQQFDKITSAYIKGDIEPYNGAFCFCGTLANGDLNWRSIGTKEYKQYEYLKMEKALLSVILVETVGGDTDSLHDLCGCTQPCMRFNIKNHINYEDALFNGMCAALDVLKQIHIGYGETIEHKPQFKKRINHTTIKIYKP